MGWVRFVVVVVVVVVLWFSQKEANFGDAKKTTCMMMFILWTFFCQNGSEKIYNGLLQAKLCEKMV